MTDTLGIYIHTPFCDGKCPYCDFYSGYGSEEDLDLYTAALKEYISFWSAKLKGRQVDTLYFGGGTPSLLGGERIETLITALKTHFNIAENAEITVEVNPRSSNGRLFEQLRASGVNRLSVGAQSFTEKELAFLGRRHSAEDTEKTVEAAKRAGFENISVDLMINLPKQSLKEIEKSIDCAAKLKVTHISAYMLKHEKGTAFEKIPPMDSDGAAEQYLFLCKELEKRGYKQYEISNFSKEGFESRHNIKYWHCKEYLGLGPAAHSFIHGQRFFYPRDTAAFIKGIDPIPDGEGGDEAERIMLALRLTEGIADGFDGREEKYIRAGLMKRENGRLSFTPEGFLVSNSVLADLI